MKQSITAGGVVIGPDNKIVVVNQNRDSWSLPKGHIDPGENEIATAKREIYEESGIKIENLELIKKLGSYKRHPIGKGGNGNDETVIKTIHIYLFKTNQTDLSPVDPQNPEARWVDIEKVSGMLTHEKDKGFFDSIKQELI